MVLIKFKEKYQRLSTDDFPLGDQVSIPKEIELQQGEMGNDLQFNGIKVSNHFK